MSIKAINWAMEQKTDGPSSVSVLWVIADRANEHGICRHADPDTIAEKSRQSRATVFRRLDELERVGLLTRLTRHADDGRREYEVRLAMDRWVNYKVDKDRSIHLFQYDDDTIEVGIIPAGAAAVHEDVESQSETDHGSQSETHAVSPVRPAESQSCDPQETPSKNPKDSPQAPQRGDAGSDASHPEGAEQPDPEGWAEFRAAFEGDGVPIARPSIAKQVLAGLSPEERKRAATAARGYIAHRSRERKPGMKMEAKTFLREPDSWAAWAKFAPPPARAATFVPITDPRFRGLQVLCAIRGRATLQPTRSDRHGADGVHVLGEVPEGLASLAQFAQPNGRIDTSGWLVAEADTKPFFAWAERLHRFSGERVEARLLVLDEKVSLQLPESLGGRTVVANKKIRGLLVPQLWPPPLKAGEGPPLQPASDEELQDLK